MDLALSGLTPPITDDEEAGPSDLIQQSAVLQSPILNQSMHSLEHITPNTSPFNTSRLSSNLNSSRHQQGHHRMNLGHGPNIRHHTTRTDRKPKNSYTFSDSSPLTSSSEDDNSDLENDNLQLKILEDENNAQSICLENMQIRLTKSENSNLDLKKVLGERDKVIRTLTRELKNTENYVTRVKKKFKVQVEGGNNTSQSPINGSSSSPSIENSPRTPLGHENYEELTKRVKKQDSLLNLLKNKMGVQDEVSNLFLFL